VAWRWRKQRAAWFTAAPASSWWLEARGIGGKVVCEGKEDAGAQRGKRSGEDAGREGLAYIAL